jgi:hypothetical protein
MTKQTKTRSRPVKKQEKGLRIAAGWQLDGGVYMLDLASIHKIQKAFPDAAIVGDMLIGYAQTKDYERYHRRYWEQIAQMLTGLTPEQIGLLGGIRIHDPAAEKDLWVWNPGRPNGE